MLKNINNNITPLMVVLNYWTTTQFYNSCRAAAVERHVQFSRWDATWWEKKQQKFSTLNTFISTTAA